MRLVAASPYCIHRVAWPRDLEMLPALQLFNNLPDPQIRPVFLIRSLT